MRILPALVALLSPFAVAANDVPQPTGRLIVEFRADQAPASLGALQGDIKTTDSVDRARWASNRGLRLMRSLARRTHLISSTRRISDTTRLEAMIRRLEATDEIVSASIEYRRFTRRQPNDPQYVGADASLGGQSYLYDGDYSIRAPGAWDISTGSPSSVIAVVDTGVLMNHPDLQFRSVAAVGYDFVSPDQPGNFTSANDGDGRDADPTDPGDHCGSGPSSWHGTGVASVAAANSDNAEGIAGVDWNARLLHARALGRCGGTDADIIDAVRWSAGLPVPGLPANETPATVVNLSIGGPTECTTAWQNVIDELNALGVPFVIAAGNESTNALRSSPANCADVVTVGSNTPAGDIDRNFSNYGLKVTVAAPGRNILMATNEGVERADIFGNTYTRETGSSFSAALVSGAISLMQSLNADLSPAAIRAILQQSASAYASDGDCAGYYCGGGVLNLVRALQFTRDGNFDEQINQETQVVDSQSETITIDQPLDGSLSGYRDVRYYRIDIDQTGMLLFRSQSEEDLFGYLLDDKLGVLALDDDSDTALNFRVAARVEPGTYYLAVERSVNRRNDAETGFRLTTELITDQPAAFSFEPVGNVAVNAPVISETVRVSGLTDSAIISVSGGFYSINGEPFTGEQGQVSNGDEITVSLQAPSAINSTVTLMLSVGAYTTEFSATTGSGESGLPPDAPKTTGSGCTVQGTGSFDPMLWLMVTLSIGTLIWRNPIARRPRSKA
jgi:serine protease